MKNSDLLKELLKGFQTIPLSEARKLDLNHRFDAKFLLPLSVFTQELSHLKEKFFLQINEKGQGINKYETQYWDTSDLNYFTDHAKGRENRLKIRKRYYRDTGDCFIEIKKKSKGKTDKVRHPSLMSSEGFTNEDKIFLHNHQIETDQLKKSICVLYERITLWSTDREGRITIDIDLEVIDEHEKGSFEHVAILEIKGTRKFHTQMLRLFEIPLLRYKTSLSKYANGVIHLKDFDASKSKLLHHVYKNLLKINNLES